MEQKDKDMDRSIVIEEIREILNEIALDVDNRSTTWTDDNEYCYKGKFCKYDMLQKDINDVLRRDYKVELKVIYG